MGRHKKVQTPQKEVTMSLETELEAVKVELEATKLEVLKAQIATAQAELAALKTETVVEEKRSLRTLDPDEVALNEKHVSRTSESSALKEKIEQQKKRDNQMVRGKFINRRAPGHPAKLTYNRYIDDPVKWYDFEDGKIYTIKQGFVDEINEHYFTPIFIQKTGPMNPDEPESQVDHVDNSNKKYAFFPLPN